MLILLVNYVISNITFNLMLDTMAGKKFSYFFQPAIGLLILPLIAFHAFGVAAETEILITRVMTALALLYFVVRLTIVAI